jgi:hypothetical protein
MSGGNLKCRRKSVHADSSAGSELTAFEDACREASRTVEACLARFQSANLHDFQDWSFSNSDSATS